MNIIHKGVVKFRKDGARAFFSSAIYYSRYKFNQLLVAIFSYFLIDTRELISYCEDRNSIWHYSEPESIEIKEPISGKPPDNKYKKYYDSALGTKTVDPAFVCGLENAKLFGPHALCQLENGRIVLEPVSSEKKAFHFFKKAIYSAGLQRVITETLITFSPFSRNSSGGTIGYLFPKGGFTLDNYPNYGHWVAENLPQLRAMEYYQEKMDEDVKLLIHQDPPKWMKDSLSCMGYSSEDWIVWSEDCKKFDSIVMPRWYHTRSSGSEVHPSGRKWVRERMINNISNLDSNTAKYIFISREGASRRQIINIEDVKNRLKPLGFQFYQPEKLSMEEEVQVFSQADVIVGPLGANLAGIMFAKNSTIIDIQPYNQFSTYYMTLANEMDLEYGFLLGDPIENDSINNPRNQDILVNVDKLENILVGIMREK